MDKLFSLYRYLSQSRHRKDEDNPYNVALRTLEPALDLLKTLDYWGQMIIDRGGIDWKDAESITERIVESHKTALCEANGQQGTVQAILDFADTHLALNEYDKLIELLTAQCIASRKVFKASEESLGDLDDHPF